MLGTAVTDPLRSESDLVRADGLRLLPIETELAPSKCLALARGRVHHDLAGVWRSMSGAPVEGYEIHLGRTLHQSDVTPLLDLDSGPDGVVSADGAVAGTYVHGLLEQPGPRQALLRALAAARGFRWQPDATPPRDAYDALADVLEHSLRLEPLLMSRP